MELIRPLWVAPLNFLGDCIRHILSVGPRWKMHLSLARKLVDRGSWFAIPLTSGTQSPIFDAIEYIVKHDDRKSIPRLEALVAKYAGSRETIHSERMFGGRVTYCFGPQDYMPLNVQYDAVKALLSFYDHWEASAFVTRTLAKDNLWQLGEDTIRHLVAEAVARHLDVEHDLITGALERINANVRRRQQSLRIA